jgi:methylenetetrahydrofolate dehydrogenase (NADP+)/methenyltetrahydrofolate cyclohydrolase
MEILDGKKLAEEIKNELKTQVLSMKKDGLVPGLAVFLVGNDEASKIYVHNKEKACEELGINSFVYRLPENTSEEKLLGMISKANQNEKIHGILIQLPLPKHINEKKIIYAIDPKKDADCFHPENVGKMFYGNSLFLPCTPAGIMELFEKYKIETAGKDVVIVGKSNIVGKPLAFMLMNKSATVTVCHNQTKNLKEKVLNADIIITAVGKAGLITADMIKSGAVVVDVGMNRSREGKLLGDVDFETVAEKAGAITPVPGGVGPMTIVELMKNTIKAAKNYAVRN